MKNLYDYLVMLNKEEEVTVWDKEYDVEVYFYAQDLKAEDEWCKAVTDLAKMLKIEELSPDGVTVNFTELIEANIKYLRKTDLFYKSPTVDNIMEGINSILSGNASTDWLVEFVDTLKIGYTTIGKMENEVLFSAACNGELSILKGFYDNGGTVGIGITKFDKWNSILLGAIRNKQHKVVSYLLYKGEIPANEEEQKEANIYFATL